MRFIPRPLALVLFVVVLGVSLPPGETSKVRSDRPLLVDPTASDQIWNEGASTPVVSGSIIQGGLSAGSSGEGTIDAEPELASALGNDGAAGTLDDDLAPTGQSIAVDAGRAELLPADRFDLDGDGDTSEPVPVDLAGNARSHDGGSGAAIPDAGAYEYGSTPTGTTNRVLPSGITLSAPFPNPARGTVRFDLETASPGRARVVIFDALGREVATAFEDEVASGRTYRLEVPIDHLASGVYIARLRTQSGTVTRRFVVER